MDVITDDRTKRFIKDLSEDAKGRILKHLDLFGKYGFNLPSKYLKKLDQNLWELRPGNIRLLLGIARTKNLIVIVHGFKKQTQKTPKKEIETAELRIKEYEQ